MEIWLGVFLFLGELKGLYRVRWLKFLEKTRIHQQKLSTHFISCSKAMNLLEINFS